ncbi:MAG: PEGA domain-containing protein [Deltaproteobacteria bacterium]|jgi:TolB-like protein
MRHSLVLFTLTATFAATASARADQRLPIAVMELSGQGVDEAAASALTTEVSNTLSQLRVFQVITREDIKRMLQLEQTKQQCTGTVDAACMAEIGGALGVDYLIYGSVAKLGTTYSLSLVLLDISKAEAANRANKKIADVGALLDETATATKLLMQPLLADKKGYLVLDMREPGAKVTVDGRLIGVSPLPGRLELPMGAHEVLIEKKGFLTWAKTVDVPPNQAAVEPVSLVPSQEFIDEYVSGARTTRTAAWITAGAGATLIATAVVLRLVANARFDDLSNKGYITTQASICAEQNPGFAGGEFCPTSEGYANDVLGSVRSIETMDSFALGAVITGGASAIVSAVLFAIGEDPGRYEAYGDTKVAVSAGQNGGALTFSF